MHQIIITLLLKRAGVSLLVLLLLVTLVFFLIRIAPGNPASKYISPNLSPELVEQVRVSFQLDKPLLEQYSSFLINIMKGEMGVSYTFRKPVVSVIKEYLPFTIIFSLLSIHLQILTSLLLALLAVKKIDGWFDRIMTRISFVVYSFPAFVLGLLLVYLFSVQFSLFPSSDLHSLDFHSRSLFGKIIDYVYHLTLPLITVSAGGIALFYKYLRDNLIETMNNPFAHYLRSHGISEKVIIRKHILPNAIKPLVSIAGVETGVLLGGALITEVIFGLPGMGRLTIEAIGARDYPLIVGCTLISGVLVILANFTADIIKALFDKRSALEMLQ
jgi:peptide/nickel transport system permease protein